MVKTVTRDAYKIQVKRDVNPTDIKEQTLVNNYEVVISNRIYLFVNADTMYDAIEMCFDYLRENGLNHHFEKDITDDNYLEFISGGHPVRYMKSEKIQINDVRGNI